VTAAAIPDLAAERYVSLATFRRNGTEVATPVWCAEVDGRLYVVTGDDSGKVRRLRAASRARVAPCNARGLPRGPWHDATARIVDDPRLINRAHTALRAKYGWQMHLLDIGSRLTGRIHHRAWVEIRLS
jgi:PPOX class probable F420-dependent enzyme